MKKKKKLETTTILLFDESNTEKKTEMKEMALRSHDRVGRSVDGPHGDVPLLDLKHARGRELETLRCVTHGAQNPKPRRPRGGGGGGARRRGAAGVLLGSGGEDRPCGG